jgi:trk system potassium uptake protein TrkA
VKAAEMAVYMRIIIIGDGKVGYSLAENLSKEDNDVIIIDKNPEALKKPDENLDVMCIKGSGVSGTTLIEAGIKDADLLIAATSSDELNMVCCLTGKKLGALRTVARIRDPEYANELSILKAELDLDMVINPELAAADEIARILRYPSAVYVESFAKGMVEMIEIRAAADLPIVGMKLSEIAGRIPVSLLIGAVVRDGEVFIPTGEFRIRENDSLYMIGKPSSIFTFYKLIGKYNAKIKNVMIVGGGRIAYYLAKHLNEMGMKVKIIDSEMERCLELTELLPHSLIIHGDGTDEELLQSESIGDMDVFISMTGKDEENLMTALVAKQNGVQKVIPKISRINYVDIVKNMGIDSVISPRTITTDHILRYVRGLKNAEGSKIESLFRIIGGKAEIVEFTANETTTFLDIPLKNIKFIKGTLIGAIARKNEIIIAHGNDVIKKGDRVIVITKNKNILDLNEIKASGGLKVEF